MKKALCTAISLLLLILLSGCGSADTPKIEDYAWELSSVVCIRDGASVTVAVGEADSRYPEAAVVDITLRAKDGRLTLTDSTSDVSYDGTYTAESSSGEGTVYRITLDGTEGYATAAFTSYSDGSKKPTLPISLGSYSMYLYAASDT